MDLRRGGRHWRVLKYFQTTQCDRSRHVNSRKGLSTGQLKSKSMCITWTQWLNPGKIKKHYDSDRFRFKRTIYPVLKVHVNIFKEKMSELLEFDVGSELEDINYKCCFSRSVVLNARYKHKTQSKEPDESRSERETAKPAFVRPLKAGTYDVRKVSLFYFWLINHFT